jgi:hypothetical protein
MEIGQKEQDYIKELKPASQIFDKTKKWYVHKGNKI